MTIQAFMKGTLVIDAPKGYADEYLEKVYEEIYVDLEMGLQAVIDKLKVTYPDMTYKLDVDVA